MESNTLIYILIAAVVGIILGLILGYLFAIRKSVETESRATRSETMSDALQQQVKQKDFEITRLNNDLRDSEYARTKAETELTNTREKVDLLSSVDKKLALKTAEKDDLQSSFNTLQTLYDTQKMEIDILHKNARIEFENIANKILETKTQRFTETNKTNMEAILTPLSNDISEFKKKVEDIYFAEAKERKSLSDRVIELVAQTDKVSDEANNLARALKGQAKKQGDWGEFILERVLEDSGLERGREYMIQKTIRNEDGQAIRPDVIVYLPDNRNVVIDSKVSLRAYDSYCAAESDDESEAHLLEHLRAIRTHIDQLSSKKYDEMNSSLDFTLMFVPIEPAYLLAVRKDDQLWNNAYQKRIILISPTNLMAVIKLISDLWNKDKQSKNAQEIARRGKLLYEKFIGFVTTLDEVGKHIEKTHEVYHKAYDQLKRGRGNLVSQAETLRSLGLETGKKLPTSLEDYDDDLPVSGGERELPEPDDPAE